MVRDLEAPFGRYASIAGMARIALGDGVTRVEPSCCNANFIPVCDVMTMHVVIASEKPIDRATGARINGMQIATPATRRWLGRHKARVLSRIGVA